MEGGPIVGQPQEEANLRSKGPVQKADGKSGHPWPGRAAAAKAYGELRSNMSGLHMPKAAVAQLPLWNTAVFQRDMGATYQCRTLIRNHAEHKSTEG